MSLPHIRASIEFKQRIGILSFDQLVSLGIEPDSLIGSFFSCHSDKVLDACVKYPTMHPITIIGGDTTINRFVAGRYVYKLGNGDPDPTLQHTRRWTTPEEYRIMVDDFLEETKGQQLDVYEQLALKIMTACAAGADPKDPRTATQFLKRTPMPQ